VFGGREDTHRRYSLWRLRGVVPHQGDGHVVVWSGHLPGEGVPMFVGIVEELFGLVPGRDPRQLLFGCCPGSLPGGVTRRALGVDEVARVPPQDH